MKYLYISLIIITSISTSRAQKIQSIDLHGGIDYNYQEARINPPLIGGNLMATTTFSLPLFELEGGTFYDIRGDRNTGTSIFEGSFRSFHHLGLHLAIQKALFKKNNRLGLFLEPSVILARYSRVKWQKSNSAYEFPSPFELSTGVYFEQRLQQTPHSFRLSYRLPLTQLEGEFRTRDDQISIAAWKFYSIRLSYIYRISLHN